MMLTFPKLFWQLILNVNLCVFIGWSLCAHFWTNTYHNSFSWHFLLFLVTMVCRVQGRAPAFISVDASFKNAYTGNMESNSNSLLPWIQWQHWLVAVRCILGVKYPSMLPMLKTRWPTKETIMTLINCFLMLWIYDGFLLTSFRQMLLEF